MIQTAAWMLSAARRNWRAGWSKSASSISGIGWGLDRERRQLGKWTQLERDRSVDEPGSGSAGLGAFTVAVNDPVGAGRDVTVRALGRRRRVVECVEGRLTLVSPWSRLFTTSSALTRVWPVCCDGILAPAASSTCARLAPPR